MESNSQRNDANHPSPSDNDSHQRYLQALQGLVHDADMLLKQGYQVEPLTASDFKGLKRCSGCNKPMKKFLRQYQYQKNISSAESNPSSKDSNPKLQCKFHPGLPVNKIWTCCRQHVSADPCSGLPHHVAADYPRDDQIEKIHQFHITPKSENRKYPNACEAVAIDCEMGTGKAGDSELIRVTMIDYFTGVTLVDRLVWPDAELLHPNTRFSGVTWAQLNRARDTRTCIFGIENARNAVWDFVGPDTIVVGHGLQNDLKSLRWIHHAVVDSFILGWIEQTPIREAKEAVVRAEIEKQRQIRARALEEKKKAEKADKEQAEKDKAEGKLVIDARHATPFSTAIAQISWQHFTTGSPGNHRCRFQTKSMLIQQNSPRLQKPAISTPIDIAQSQKQPAKPKSRGSGDLSLKTLTLVKLGREIQTAEKKGHDSLEDAIAARDLVYRWITTNYYSGEEVDGDFFARLSGYLNRGGFES
ncbi:RNA exonuclease [Venturia nashicola]|nr:RNA exonuclease [Venturia nashicola]